MSALAPSHRTPNTTAGAAGESVAVIPYEPASKAHVAPGKGSDKAAVLLVALGTDRAARVLSHMSDDEIEAASLRMAQLQHVDPVTTDAVMHEFVDTVRSRDSLTAGGMDYANEVLVRALGPDLGAEMIGRVSSAFEKRPFEFLRHMPAARIARVLFDESTQVKALVVANLHRTLAAQVLSQLSDPDQAEVALRVALMDDVNPEVVREVEDTMRRKFASASEPDTTTTVGGAKSLAEILAHTDVSAERKVLDFLNGFDSDLAAEVRQLLFTFDDLMKLDDRAIQLVLREADQEDVSLSLRGVSDELKHKILSNMSERAARMLLEELEYQRPQRKRFIDEAQGRIVAIVRRLEDAGLVIVPRDDDLVL